MSAKEVSNGTVIKMSALEKILKNLDERQRLVVTAAPGAVCVIAGAGTGKTTALIGRIAYQSAAGAWNPDATLALTHSAKAAGNMRDRLPRDRSNKLGSVTLKTFHATALAICKENWNLSGVAGDLDLLTNTYGAVKEALRKKGVKDPDTTVVMDMTSEIGWAKSSLLTPDQYAAKAQEYGRGLANMTLSQVATTYQIYEELLVTAGKVDFSDLLKIATSMILSNSNLEQQLRQRWQHLLVDEYQDTDPAQEALLGALLSGRGDLTVVGDARQAIYAFKGARVELLESFPQRFPGSNVIRLVKDYRSTPQITNTANTLMSTPDSDALIGVQPNGPTPVLLVAQDESDEARQIAARIKRLIDAGTPASKIAVLYRYNAQSAPFETALGKLGIAVTVLDSEKFFDRPEVVAVLRDTWRQMLAQEASNDQSSTGLDLLNRALANAGFDSENPPGVAGGARERWEALNALLELVQSWQSKEPATPRQLLDELALRSKESHQVATQTVTLSTLHKAKGLEWDVVFLPRMVEGSLPSAYALTQAALDEERRLTYVGITRAAHQLTFSYSKTRGSATRSWPATPSRYLTEAGIIAAGKSKPTQRATKASTPVPPSALAGADLQVFEQLRQWRSQAAKASGMPAFVVASDAVLTQVAIQRPADRAALLRIPGLGTRNVEKIGKELLEIVANSRE